MPDTAEKFARVMLDEGLNKPLDYRIPEQCAVEQGCRVVVPVRGSLRKATVIELTTSSPYGNAAQAIHAIDSEVPALTKELFALAEWVARYYATPLRRVLRLFIPNVIRRNMAEKTQFFVKKAIAQKALRDLAIKLAHTSPTQAKVLHVLLKQPKGMLLTELLESAGVSKSPVETLMKKRVLSLEKTHIDRSPLEHFDYFPTKPKTPNQQQQQALDRIIATLDANTFAPFLIHGVTGSGKTEIYLQAIAHARKQGKGVLMLVPEIALTMQTIERFQSRFQEQLGIFHHRLSDGERSDIWRAIHDGSIRIVIGARSAVFAPIQHLGLIVVDEEQDSSYKQSDEMPCYNARDVSLVRAKKQNATVLLGSATPSLESYKNALDGKYHMLTLSNRSAKARFPHVHTVNMKREYEQAGRFTLFSQALIDGIKKRLSEGEQTLLFLNKRGYHAFLLCTECNHIEKCRHCDISLTFHRGENTLACHQCGYTVSPIPKECTSCKKPATLKMKGYGTEQVQRSLHALFPEIRTLRMDADTTRHKGSHDTIFKQFRSGKADVLIGTQMIAKGLHFPSVTLVGIINADAALNIPDFRSSEYVFQLLTQVAGRSGRGALPGEVVIQTMLEDHPVIKYAAREDYEGFYKEETTSRKLFAYPPFSQLIKCVISGTEEKLVQQCAEQLQKAILPSLPHTFSLYPALPCGIAKIKDRYRYKIIIQGNPIHHIATILPSLIPNFPKDIRLLIDVGPISTF